MNWLKLAQEVVEGKAISDQEAMNILHCDDDDLLLLMHGAFHIRKIIMERKLELICLLMRKVDIVQKTADTVQAP